MSYTYACEKFNDSKNCLIQMISKHRGGSPCQSKLSYFMDTPFSNRGKVSFGVISYIKCFMVQVILTSILSDTAKCPIELSNIFDIVVRYVSYGFCKN